LFEATIGVQHPLQRLRAGGDFMFRVLPACCIVQKQNECTQNQLHKKVFHTFLHAVCEKSLHLILVGTFTKN
jgi:hypothetical protein